MNIINLIRFSKNQKNFTTIIIYKICSNFMKIIKDFLNKYYDKVLMNNCNNTKLNNRNKSN